MVVEQKLMTADAFLAMPDLSDKRVELVEGEIVEMPGTGHTHARVVVAIFRLLDAFVLRHNLGEVFVDGLGYLTRREPDTVRVPDVSFIAADRIPDEGFRSYIPFAPDLAVEIVSPDDRAQNVHDKAREYLATGAQLVWVVWPKNREVTVCARGEAIRELGADDELDGGTVLPGFRVKIADLFAVRTMQ